MNRSDKCWLLLHGTPLTPAVWDEVAAHLAASGAHSSQVLRPSVTPAGDAADPQAQLAGRLLAGGAVPERVHVVGHSFGGQVALDLALLAPDRVRTLALICSRDTPFPPFAMAAAALRRGEPVDIDAALSRWFTAAEREADYPVVRYARRCLEQADRTSWAAALDGIARYDRSARVGAIDVPTLLIAAELDPVSTPAAMSALAGRLPTASVMVLPGAAHMSPFADPAALTDFIVEAARSTG